MASASRYEAIQCSLLAAATDLRLKDSARARALSESALPEAERLGARASWPPPTICWR